MKSSYDLDIYQTQENGAKLVFRVFNIPLDELFSENKKHRLHYSRLCYISKFTLEEIYLIRDIVRDIDFDFDLNKGNNPLYGKELFCQLFRKTKQGLKFAKFTSDEGKVEYYQNHIIKYAQGLTKTTYKARTIWKKK